MNDMVVLFKECVRTVAPVCVSSFTSKTVRKSSTIMMKKFGMKSCKITELIVVAICAASASVAATLTDDFLEMRA